VTKTAARTVANLVLVSAGVAAAYVVITTPPLRRLANIASRRWLGASVPGFLIAAAGRAWAESRSEGVAASPGRHEGQRGPLT
jgi:hypothetical protein